MDDTHHRYQSPLATRNASPEMLSLFSPHRKFSTWRRLWLALAEAQQQLGLPIGDEQLRAMRDHLDDIDFTVAAAHEKRLRHDVMAHVHTFGEAAPEARGIIHWGATSCFVTDNADVLILRDALVLIARKLATLIDCLARFAQQHRDLPTLGYTHFQPAQPTTVGKRATLWAWDACLALEEIEHRLDRLRFRGVKGTTGTQASFLQLFDHDHAQVDALERAVAQRMGFSPDQIHPVTGQTYPRLVDAQVVNALAVAAAAVSKCATDLRLLAHLKEVEEPFESEQIGSSAMAYKRNPMRCERATGLARFVINAVGNPLDTHATQWLERTLDDSANRRLSLPEPFLALDGALETMINVAGGLVVYPATIAKHLRAELPFMATETLLMAAVTTGADRQSAHEVIRRHSQAAAERVKREGGDNDLLERLSSEPMFAGLDLHAELDPHAFVGRAPQQVDAFLAEVVAPIRQRYADAVGYEPELKV